MLARLALRGALLCATSLCAAEPPAGGCGTLRVGFYEDGALYYRTGDGGWAGINKEVVDEVARRLDCAVTPVRDSHVRIWAGIATGVIDVSVSTLRTPDREKLGYFVPYLAGHNYVLLKASLADRVTSMEAFLAHPEYKVAVVKTYKFGKTYSAWLEKLRAQGQVFEAADYPAMLRLFKLGRVDALLITSSSMTPPTRAALAGTFRVVDWAPGDSITGNLFLSRQRFDAAAAARFEKAVRAMRDDGTLKRLYARHVGPEVAAGLANY